MKTLSIVFVAALSFAALGCKKKAGAGPDCAKAINHSMELSKAEMQKMGTDDKTMQKLVDLGIQRCKEDKWSADAINCMIDAKAMADAQGCYGKLTAEQQAKMNKAAMEIATAGQGSAGAAPTTGSAAGSDTGSAAAGSAAGSDTGSAAGGSAAGSAAGSGEAGSAGSAAPQ